MEFADFCNAYEVTPSWQQDFQAICSELDFWIDSIPPRLIWNDPDAYLSHIQRPKHPAILMLHGYFHALMIHLNGFIATATRGAVALETQSESHRQSHERCLRSSHALAEIVNQAALQGVNKLGWPFAWSVWVAARFLISWENITGHNRPETSGNISTFSNFLDRMSRYSQISSTYARLLRQVLSEVVTGDVGGQSTLRDLISDWRVPTSRLEDQIRPDPMLHSAASPSLAEGNINSAEVHPLNPVLPLFANDAWMEMAQSSPDSWFRGPSFALSAYENFNETRQE
jgi:hypothetical protein